MFANRMRSGRMMLVPLALAGALVLGACGDDGEDNGDDVTATPTTTVEATASPTQATTETATATATPTEAAQGETIEVTTVDYAFEDLPETVSVGDTLTITNASEAELHELVAFRIPDGEERSVEDLLALPEEEQMALFAGPPSMVLIAMPGEDGMPVLGTGEVTEAGRYVVACFIPVGADPQEYIDAAQSSGDEPPEVEGGPPHFVEGMFGEFTAE